MTSYAFQEGNIMEALPSEPPASSSSSSSGNGNGGSGSYGGPSSPIDGDGGKGKVGRVHLVDFEFAGSNWRSFDLANALLEAAIDNQV
jgi:thiamine kinase-like enzyme